MTELKLKRERERERTDFKLYESIECKGRMFEQFTKCAMEFSFLGNINNRRLFHCWKKCSHPSFEFFLFKDVISSESNFTVLSFRENSNCLRFTYVVNVFSGIAEINYFTYRVVGLGRWRNHWRAWSSWQLSLRIQIRHAQTVQTFLLKSLKVLAHITCKSIKSLALAQKRVVKIL